MTPCIDLLPNCYCRETLETLENPRIPSLPLICSLSSLGSCGLSSALPLTSLPLQCYSHLPYWFRTEAWEPVLVLTPEQIISAFLSADLEGIFLPSVDRIINYSSEGMLTFLISFVIHIIFQTLEWWAGISSKGGPTNQAQCDFGFISLCKHLVLLSARQERGGKHAETLTALSPVFPLCYETYHLR